MRTYSRIYRGVFKDEAEMPPNIRRHIRYPRDLFDIQMRIYAKYHQTDPKVFYQEEDLWTYADEFHQDKAGSQVIRGRVIILPIGRSIFYIQPVYLKSSSRPQIPELQRIIISEGQLAVMETSLDEAYKKLYKRVRSELKQSDEHYPPLSPEVVGR